MSSIVEHGFALTSRAADFSLIVPRLARADAASSLRSSSSTPSVPSFRGALRSYKSASRAVGATPSVDVDVDVVVGPEVGMSNKDRAWVADATWAKSLGSQFERSRKQDLTQNQQEESTRSRRGRW